jgi:hypothetical protein
MTTIERRLQAYNMMLERYCNPPLILGGFCSAIINIHLKDERFSPYIEDYLELMKYKPLRELMYSGAWWFARNDISARITILRKCIQDCRQQIKSNQS